MKRLLALCAAAVLACASPGLHAAPPSPEAIDTLLRLTRAEQLVDQLQAQLDPMLRKMLSDASAGRALSAEQQRAFDALPGRIAQVYREEMAWSNMRPLYVQIYQESFTQEEVDGLIAFYRSPAGAALVEKMPVVTQRSVMAVQQRIGPLMQKIKAAVDDAVAAKPATP